MNVSVSMTTTNLDYSVCRSIPSYIHMCRCYSSREHRHSDGHTVVDHRERHSNSRDSDISGYDTFHGYTPDDRSLYNQIIPHQYSYIHTKQT